MRTTPKKRKRQRELEAHAKELSALPPEHMMGPSREWLARGAYQLEYRDNCAEWEAELIDEYGFDRAVRVTRMHPTPKRARAVLEAERLRNEAARWANGGRLPFGQ